MYIYTNTGLGQVAITVDINKAIRNNRIYRQQLGWHKYYDTILKFLGFTSKPTETDFAQGVARWQQSQGLKVDGTIGTLTWKALLASGIKTSQTYGTKEAAPGPVTTMPTTDTIKSAAARLAQFDKNSAKLKDFHIPSIDSVADRVVESRKTEQPIRTIKVIGHTSSEGPAQYNIGLGYGRALAVRKVLQKALERKQKNLSYRVLILAQSKGANEPIDSNETEEGRSQNRRVEVFLSSKQLKPRRSKRPGPLTIPPQKITGKIINWDEKFERHFDNCCASEQLRRMPCSLLIGVRGAGGIMFTSCKVLPKDWRTVFPEDIRRMIEECCKSGSDREATVDNCVLVGVLAEISEELGGVSAETVKQIEPKYREWKSRSNKLCI